MNLRLTFRLMALAVAALGLVLGASFGAGVAYGRGTPKQAPAGPTVQQVQTQLGLGGGAQGAAGQGGGSGQQGAAGQGGTGASAAQQARSTSGRITSISGQTVTIETRQGSVRLNLAPATTVRKLSVGTVSELREGMTIVAAGARRDDGSYDVTSISELPPELEATLGGGATPGTGAPQSPGQQMGR